MPQPTRPLSLPPELEEPDLVMGVAAIRQSEPSLTDLVQLHRATGNYQDAATCYR